MGKRSKLRVRNRRENEKNNGFLEKGIEGNKDR